MVKLPKHCLFYSSNISMNATVGIIEFNKIFAQHILNK